MATCLIFHTEQFGSTLLQYDECNVGIAKQIAERYPQAKEADEIKNLGELKFCRI